MDTAILLLAQEVDVADRAVIATDAEGRIIYWGEGAERLFGWTKAEVLGTNVLDITPSDMSGDEAREIMRTLRAGDPWSGEFVVRTKSGVRFAVRVTDIPVHDKAGRLQGIVGISRRMGTGDEDG
jgi:PAS domain S-box-containing protein